MFDPLTEDLPTTHTTNTTDTSTNTNTSTDNTNTSTPTTPTATVEWKSLLRTSLLGLPLLVSYDAGVYCSIVCYGMCSIVILCTVVLCCVWLCVM